MAPVGAPEGAGDMTSAARVSIGLPVYNAERYSLSVYLSGDRAGNYNTPDRGIWSSFPYGAAGGGYSFRLPLIDLTFISITRPLLLISFCFHAHYSHKAKYNQNVHEHCFAHQYSHRTRDPNSDLQHPGRCQYL